MLDASAKKQIDVLEQRAWIGWKQMHAPKAAPVLEHPDMAITFYVSDGRADRDNKLSTLLDVLQKAHVIRNDNIAHCNARMVLNPAVFLEKSQEEFTTIQFPGELSAKR